MPRRIELFFLLVIFSLSALPGLGQMSQSSPAEGQELCGYKWAAHLIFSCEFIQIEALKLRLVNVR